MATDKNRLNRGLFFELVRAGLWSGYSARILSQGTPVDWEEVYRLAEEQSVVGLIAAGLDTLPFSERPPQTFVLQLVGTALQIEQQNKAMNEFVARLVEKLRKEDVFAILVKGQGIAQCYEKPLWRSCGDIDLLLSEENYKKAKALLEQIADNSGRETAKNTERLHQECQISGWTVELHGTMHANLSRRIDREIDKVQRDVFYGGQVRSWLNGETQVFLPREDEDVIFVFTHILQHLFLEGIGLRQICDWCRLLWTYKDSLNHRLLESRIKKMGLITEWRVLGTMAIDFLGMPREAMPLLNENDNKKFKKKAAKLMEFVMEVGNFGHNREVDWSNGFKRRSMLIWHRITDTIKLSRVFPVDAPKFLLNYAWDGFRGVVKS